MTAPAARLAQLRLRRIRLQREVALARAHPAHLLEQMSMVDEKTGELFQFHLSNPEDGWFWQREELDRILETQKIIWLKARQLGLTWLCAAYQMADMLLRPGTRHLVFRQKEDYAAEIIARQWQLFSSLPEHLRFGVEVITPARGFQPTLLIELRHPDGRISTIRGMASTERSGHGPTSASVLLDEAARIEKLAGIWTAVNATVGTTGKVFVVSTANGRASAETGEGNFYHLLWLEAEDRGLTARFCGWQKHPDRDQDWYEHSAETQALDPRARGEQYPSNPAEAFELTDDVYFDRDALNDYSTNHVSQPLERFSFQEETAPDGSKRGKRVDGPRNWIEVYAYPTPGHEYAIGADVATGHGTDWSVAYVIDLTSREISAQFRAKLDLDLYATQLHYLGKWYSTAVIGIETATGHGNAVIIPLRDGRAGRPPYPALYRHVLSSRPDRPTAKPYGFPINKATRRHVVEQMEKTIRERLFPHMPARLLAECGSFVKKPDGTSPRAQDGHADDCVLACAITLELHRLYGEHAEAYVPRRQRRKPSAAELIARKTRRPQRTAPYPDHDRR